MSKGRLPRYAAKRDKIEPEIIAALEAVGAVVEQISAPGFCDLVVFFRGDVSLLECKSKTGRLTPAQQKKREKWTDIIVTVRSVKAALNAIGLEEGHLYRQLVNHTWKGESS